MECFISCALYRADVIELFIEGRRVHSISRDLIDVFVIEVNGTQTNKKGLFYVNDLSVKVVTSIICFWKF